MEFLDLDRLRRRATRKWTFHDSDVLPLWIAESDFPTLPGVVEYLHDLVSDESFGYCPPPTQLQEALCGFYQRRYGWAPQPSEVFPVGDVVRGLHLGIEFFTRPGSGVIVPTPAYPPFLQLPQATHRATHLIDARGGIDPADVEREFSRGAGALLLCSPHNPLGFTFTRDELVTLAEIADAFDARILVDEIHAPLTYGEPTIPAASVSDAAARVCLTVTATSKAFNIAGLKCAQMILTNPRDQETHASLPPILFEGASTLGLKASAYCYNNGDEYLDSLLEQLRRNRDYVADTLPSILPGARITRPEATYLSWVDLRETPLGSDPARLLLEHGRVAFNDGADFGESGRGHIRFNFATSPAILDSALERMARAATVVTGL